MQILTDLSEIVNNGGQSVAPAAILQASVQGASVNMQNDEVLTAALISVGAVSAGLTNVRIQIEEWNGTTASGSTWTAIPNQTSITAAASVTSNTLLTILGLRTQGYARINVLTLAGTTVGAFITGVLLGMPKSSGGSAATGFSRSPSS